MSEHSGSVRCPVCQHDRFRRSLMPRTAGASGAVESMPLVIAADKHPLELAHCLRCSHVLFVHSIRETPLVVFHDDGTVEWFEE